MPVALRCYGVLAVECGVLVVLVVFVAVVLILCYFVFWVVLGVACC